MTDLNDEEAVERALAATEEYDFATALNDTIGTLEKAVDLQKAGRLSQESKKFFSNVLFDTAQKYIVAVEEQPELAQPNLAWRLSEVFDKLAPEHRDHEARVALNLISQLQPK